MKLHLCVCIVCFVICIAAAPVSAMQPLGVEITHTPDPVRMGETVTYTINYTNPNPDPVYNIEIDAFLAGGATPHWDVGTLTGGATGSAGWTGSICVPEPGFYTDTVTIRSDETGSFTLFGETAVVYADPIILDITDAVDPVRPGECATFTVTYSNPNPFPLTSVCITGFLPSCLSFVSSTCDGIFCAVTCTVEWFIGTICGGYTGMVSFCGIVSPPSPGTEDMTTAVSVRSDEAGCQNGVVETTTIEDDIPVPEFPSPAVPVAMITGCIAVCALGRRRM